MAGRIVSITVRAGQGAIANLPGDVHAELADAMSYHPAGYEYTWAYLKGRTDGKVHLFKNHKFPAGLLERVLVTLREHDIEYDLTVEPVSQKPDLVLEAVDIEQRDYQDEAVEAALLNARGVIQSPTGSGKTAMGCRIVAARAKRAFWIVPTIDLLHQTREFLEAHLFDPNDREENGRVWIGQMGDGVVDPQPVTVATIRTAAKALGVAYEKYEFGEYDDSDDTEVEPNEMRDFFDAVGTLIVDEAHILGANEVFNVAVGIPAPIKIGMSASPWRDDGADLKIEAATGPKIYRVSTAELVAKGYLVPPLIRVVKTQGLWTPAPWGEECLRCHGTVVKRTRKGAKYCANCKGTRFRSQFTDCYREEIVENDIRNAMIAKDVADATAPVLVLVKQVKHGKRLEKMIAGSVFLSGKDRGSKRQEVYRALLTGEVRVVIATTIADLGLDLPALNSLVLAGLGKSSVRHLQRIGRVVRPGPGKASALVIDYDDSHVHRWFREHTAERRKIEKAEWGETALWI